MIDVNSSTTTRPVQQAARTRAVVPAGSAPAGSNNGADAAGKKPPDDGRTLPVASAGRMEAPDLERLAESLANFARQLNRDLRFSVHEASGRTVVTVLDGETREVIRQIPSEEALRMAEALAESRGVLLDRKA